MQEALYHCLPEAFPYIIYANTNIPEKLFRVLRSQKEVGNLRDGSNNIFNEICLTDMLIGQMKAFVMDAVMY